jgi:hypothetical protein
MAKVIADVIVTEKPIYNLTLGPKEAALVRALVGAVYFEYTNDYFEHTNAQGGMAKGIWQQLNDAGVESRYQVEGFGPGDFNGLTVIKRKAA